MKVNLDGFSIPELREMQKPLLLKVANSLCSWITREIDNNGLKKNVRMWLKSLRYTRDHLLEFEKMQDNAIIDIIKSAEQEAEEYLFIPKRG